MGTLESFIDRMLGTDWRPKYTKCLKGDSYRAGLRRMLGDVGIKMWLELEFGTSYKGYRSIDCYVSIFYPGMAPPQSSAWYLLNQSRPPLQRNLYRPDEWYYCSDWLSIGQRSGIAEWTIVATDELARRSYQDRAVGHRRMMALQRHLNPRPRL